MPPKQPFPVTESENSTSPGYRTLLGSKWAQESAPDGQSSDTSLQATALRGKQGSGMAYVTALINAAIQASFYASRYHVRAETLDAS
jgi:hypothetical protein